jgi:ribosomal protein S18 acetylase RimI-like enzyme
VNGPATAATAKRLVELPASLRAGGFQLRTESEGDIAFLKRLYISIRWPELEPTAWPDDAKVDFLRSQFEMQRRHYRTHYSDAAFAVLEQRAEPAGRLYLLRGPEDFRIVDISLLPEYRGQGVGTALLRAVIQEATTKQASVSIHVEKFNPAQRLYRRLGFVEAAESGPYWLMIRPSSETL